ncbi:hypothetical protein [Tateyamaria sp. Alg231-49]|uniref:hypothetical protein n=1 Tax=Tateyamaria sp. Alg231-49 TaxID=1922219 RepID=UPI000D55EBF5|nr:hypothetical protein [Tateyamaria sp. Alg231-49]
MNSEQEDFFKKHLKKSKYARNSKKKNDERQRKYEAYLQLKDNVARAIANLPDTVSDKKPGLVSMMEGADKTVSDFKTLGTAFESMQQVELQVTAVMDLAKSKAKNATPKGQILLLVSQATSAVMAEGTAGREKFEKVATKFEARLGDSAGLGLVQEKAFTADHGSALQALQRIPGQIEDDVDAAEAKIKEIRDAWDVKRRKHEADLGNLLKNPSDLVDSINNSKARGDLLALLREADALIQDLERWDNVDAPTLRGDYKKLYKLSSDASQDFEALKSEGETLLKDATKIKTLHTKQYYEDAAALSARITALRKNGGALNFKKLKKEQTAQLLGLIQQCEATLFVGCNAAMLVPLETLVADAEAMLHDLQNAEVTNAHASKNLKEIATLLKSGLGSKAIRQTDLANLTKELTDLNGEWVSMAPQDAQQAILDLKLKTREAVKNEQEQQEWRKLRLAEISALEKELATLNKEFQAFLKSKGEKKANYQGSMASDLALCKTWTTTKEHRSFESTVETKLADARSNIANALARLKGTNQKDILLGELLTEHKSIEEGKSDAEKARQQLLTNISDFESELKTAKKENPALKTHPEDLALVANTLKQAKDAAKKGGDSANGERLLKAAKDRLADAIKKPAKLDYDSLGKIGENWSKAHAAFLEKVTKLSKEVNDLADSSQEKERAKKLSDQLSAAADRMEADGFDAVADKLKEEKTPEGERKANREKALALVRTYRDVVPGDQLIKVCAGGAPFEGGKNFAGPVHQCLREIELEVLRGI